MVVTAPAVSVRWLARATRDAESDDEVSDTRPGRRHAPDYALKLGGAPRLECNAQEEP